jgi:uncharacterized protein (DUF58 family)
MPRFLILGGLALILVLAGLATLNGDLLSLALPLLVYLSAGLLFGPREIHLRIERSLSPQRLAAGEPVSVRLSVTNLGPTLDEVLIEDILPAKLELMEGAFRAYTRLDHGAGVELVYTLCGRRGIYNFPGARAIANDRLGISTLQRVFPAHGQIFILPETPHLRRVAIRPRLIGVYSGEIPARLGGAGVEFFGVRHYSPGDPMRHINWRISARQNEAMFSNEFEQERVADAWIILDARLRSDIQKPGESLFDFSVTSAAGLALALLSQGNRVGLLVYGGFLDWTYPGYGRLQSERILRALARARPGESMIFDRLENLPSRVFPPYCPLLLVSPLQYEDLPVLVHLRARGYQVLVISPDPLQFEAESLPVTRASALGLRVARVERNLLLDQLRHSGVQVFNWDVSVSFDRAMHIALSRALPQLDRFRAVR